MSFVSFLGTGDTVHLLLLIKNIVR